MSWLPAEVTGLMLDLLGLPEPRVRTDVAHHPELWADLCGRIGSRRGSPTCAGAWPWVGEPRCMSKAAG